jgi:hypothetical protein
MCTTRLKKTALIVDNSPKILEMDELYWFIHKKEDTQMRENVHHNDGEPKPASNRWLPRVGGKNVRQDTGDC